MNFSAMETLLQQTIFPELEIGRPNYDKPHTIGVVAKVKDLIAHNPQLNLDEAVLIITAYAHDWGYAGLFHNSDASNYAAVKNAKAEHMVISAQKLTHLLTNNIFDQLTSEQKSRAIHLVSVHDKLDVLKDVDELVFMEADTLGGLDMDYVKPTFDKESNEQFMRGGLQKRLSLFITDYGKQEVARLVKLRQEYYENQPFSAKSVTQTTSQ